MASSNNVVTWKWDYDDGDEVGLSSDGKHSIELFQNGEIHIWDLYERKDDRMRLVKSGHETTLKRAKEAAMRQASNKNG